MQSLSIIPLQPSAAAKAVRTLELVAGDLALRYRRWRIARSTHATAEALSRLDDRMLRDIGISRVDALHEAERAPWDLAPRA